MIKLLIILAAVAAIAAASTSATVEFPDLEDLDADGLQDDVADDEVDVADNFDLEGTVPRSCSVVKEEIRKKYNDPRTQFFMIRRRLSCPQGFYRMFPTGKFPNGVPLRFQLSGICTACPNGRPGTAYGKSQLNCDISSCSPCDPGHTFERLFGMCLTPSQVASLLSNEVEDDDVQKNDEMGSLGGKGGGNHTATLQSQVQTLQEDLQQFEEATVSSCCLPGYYGHYPDDCRECPKERPSSPHSAGGGPQSGVCPNRKKNSCFACPKCFVITDPFYRVCERATLSSCSGK